MNIEALREAAHKSRRYPMATMGNELAQYHQALQDMYERGELVLRTSATTDTAALERLADECRDMGNEAHQQPGASKYMRTLWKAEALIREVLARRKAEAWQPISSAPLDKNILVFRPAMWGGKGHIGVAKWNTDEFAKRQKPFWESCEGWVRQTDDRAYPPTHWQPLPAPPEAEGCRNERA